MAGALLSQVLSKIFAVYHSVKLIQKLERFISVYCVFIDRTLDGYTSSYLEKLELSTEDGEGLRNSFEVLKTMFRKNVLAIILTSYPRAYVKYARFRNWQELEKYVESGQSRKKQ